jgi:hypothetical protein
MSWKKLLAENKIHAHSTSKKELDALRARHPRLGGCSGKGIVGRSPICFVAGIDLN